MNKASYCLELSNKPLKTGHYAIMFKMVLNGEKRRISLNVPINKVYWKPRKSGQGYYLSTSCPDYQFIKQKFSDLRSQSENYLLDKRKKKVTALELQKYLKGEGFESYFNYGYSIADRYIEKGSIARGQQIRGKLNKFKKYVKQNDLSFKDITIPLINKYVHYLRTVVGNQVNTIKGCDIKLLKFVFNCAIEEQVIDANYNPFMAINMKMKGEKVIKDRLDLEEIEKIKSLELTDILNDVRNIFLFCFFCGGARIGDALYMEWKNIDIKNRRLHYIARKGEKEIDILIPPDAVSILEYYMQDRKKRNVNDFVFPFLNPDFDYTIAKIYEKKKGSKTSLINKKLKKIATLAGINAHLTTHIARHSFANIAANTEGISLKAVQEMLGHSSVQVTERYLGEFDRSKKDNTMKTLFKF